ncbi:MAG: hypothetical protein L0332_29820 [Chloroflexi bacterium]|nr:hypothetical protein [Chloroflexota bacterium]MCI0580313.1 hypothetical protein [Chloroflexota bacterium]MCI0648068.1 hypothetical protein [Chloroflexota bacterium]MCI0730899.1 hypothetical protein [Chloroflexota bacterium]
MPTLAIESFIGTQGSAAVTGGSGSGKSTALAALKQSVADRTLLVSYPIQNWPQGKRPWMPGLGHVSQIMAAAATEITERLEKAPTKFTVLNPIQKEFLFWLVEKHLRRRTLVRLGYRLNQSVETPMEIPATIEDFYPSGTQEADVWGQLGELVELAQALGYEQTLLLIDLEQVDVIKYLDDIITLFSWLDLMELPGYAIRAALPEMDVIQRQIVAATSGRLNLIRLDYSEATVDHIVRHYLRVATDNECPNLDHLADSTVLKRGKEEIEQLYGTSTLSGWLNWAEALLAMYSAQPSDDKLSDSEAAIRVFYQRHIPLRLEPDKQGVWRGPQFRTLHKQPFEILRKLFELKGQPNPDALLEVAGGSGQNLNTLVNRLREELEPVKGTNIYLHNRRDQGYWLENFIL